MRALVTGAAGFVGQWLCKRLLAEGWEVTGAVLEEPVAGPTLTAEEQRRIRWVPGDLRHQEAIDGALGASRPEAVFHLAAVSFVPAAGGDPGIACDVNVTSATRLCHAIGKRRAEGTIDPTVLIVGSAEQYGRYDAQRLPLSEETPQRPLTVYGATKAAQEVMALQAWRAHGVRVICTRSFSHAGPGQESRYLLPAVVRRALALRDTGEKMLAIGNVSTVRDFLHVGDVVDAYIRLVRAGTPGEAYNVSSGTGVIVRDLVDLVLRLTGVEAFTEEDPALVRPVEIPALVGDSTKLRRATGWSPQRSCDDIVQDLIDATAH